MHRLMQLVLFLVFSLSTSSTTSSALLSTNEDLPEECMTHGLNCPGCGLYLAPSRALGFGRGIIAGKNYVHGDALDNAPSITVPNEVAESMILHNYIYSSEDEQFGMISFGPSMIFNHKRLDKKDVDHTWADENVPTIDQQLLAAHSTYTNVVNSAIRNISIGEEIFTSYGEDDWFLARDIEMKIENSEENFEDKSNSRYDLTELENGAYPCLTDVFIDESNLPGAGRGLFATRNFTAGELITVSPILALPSESVEETYEDSVLVNFCFTCGIEYDFVMFPLGLLAMANHAPVVDRLEKTTEDILTANMKLDWHFFREEDKAVLKESIEDVLGAQFSKLDISAIALRDIVAGEELLIDYGTAWEDQWRMFERDTKMWEEKKDFDPEVLYTYDFLLTKPQFRFPIELSDGFCPTHWEYSGEDTIFKFSSKFNDLYNDHYMEVEGEIIYDDNEETVDERDQNEL